MDGEIQSFIKVWILAITSVCYCYYIVSNLPKGFIRLLFILPIISLFIILSLNLNTYFHLFATTIFYLVWLANFKLLLFAFDKDPLSSSLSLVHFISIALLPIKTKQKADDKTPITTVNQKWFVLATIILKVFLLGTIVYIYQYQEYIHPSLILVLYCCHIYLGVEIILFVTGIPVQVILGLEIEPQFNEPYLSTSLQDFWGRRWNLMVTSILRPTVYFPVKHICTRILGRSWSTKVAIFSTFLVSGLMHEIIYYYVTRVWPTWEVTWFFVIHGICTAIEVGFKKALGDRWQLHKTISRMITVGFVAVTAVWLFFPQILRNGVDRKAIDEYSVLVQFVKDRLGFHEY